MHALYDGDQVEPYETVLTIEGDYTAFAHLETVYLGVLARRTLITSNVVRVLEAANGKPIIFMPARHDHHRIQTGDGYAAYVAGKIVGAPIGVTTDEQASWWGGRGIGTVPHALIGAYGGNTVLAATKFAEWAPDDFNVTVLVDFENNSVETALEVARALGPRLWGVRLDTSETLVDRSLWDEMGGFKPTGVNERLVRKVRDALDADGFERVRIVVSGGFDIAKISEFERQRRARRRVRRRLVADPRLERLHGGHRAHRRPPVREGRAALQAELAARARRVAACRSRRGPSCGPRPGPVPGHGLKDAPMRAGEARDMLERPVSGRILWDVDTQVDFMLPDGKLYVRGAEETAPAMGGSSRRRARPGSSTSPPPTTTS